MIKPNRYIWWLAIFITLVLFVIPFFWFAPGFIDLGGDAGRFYLLEPQAMPYHAWNSIIVFSYAAIPYFFFLSVLLEIVKTPTNLIALEHGLQLSVSFLSVLFIIKEILSNLDPKPNSRIVTVVGIVSGMVYVVFITKIGWSTPLETLNQVFLNPLMFYLLLKYCITGKFIYIIQSLFVTILFSWNFSLGDLPQLLSFYPFALTFLFLYIHLIAKKPILWKGLLIGILFFIGLHSVDIIPIINSLFHKESLTSSLALNVGYAKNAGVDYFAANHVGSGKMSKELFQSWLGQNGWGLIVPIISLLGFFHRKTKLLAMTGIFFSITLFLTVANITKIGVYLYQLLFYIPGFVMFRSFNEKWYFVFAFFYALLFAGSFYYFLEKKKQWFVAIFCLVIFGVSIVRLIPFLSGGSIRSTLFQSDNVPTSFKIDPDLLNALTFIRKSPGDDKVITFPLTFPDYQVAYGKEGGAYVGISMVTQYTNKQSYSGFWGFGSYERSVFDTLQKQDINRFIQQLSLLNVRYIFRNSDPRIIDKFPGYPYVFPGMTYSNKDQLPIIKDQNAYDTLLASLPIKKIYENGHYQIYELESTVARPLIYIPNYIYSDNQKAFMGSSYRTAYVDPAVCAETECDIQAADVPVATFHERSPSYVDVRLDLKEAKKPFLLAFLNKYNSSWDLSLQGVPNSAIKDHIVVNGYANGWIIDPKNIASQNLHGRIYLMSQNYMYAGAVISGISFIIFILVSLRVLITINHEKK